jgi:hypothetical protein
MKIFEKKPQTKKPLPVSLETLAGKNSVDFAITENEKISKIIELLNSITYRKMVRVQKTSNLDMFEYKIIKDGRGLTLKFQIPFKHNDFISKNFKNASCRSEGTKKYLIGMPYHYKLFTLDYSMFVIDYL